MVTEDTESGASAKQCSTRMFGEEAVKSRYVDIINGNLSFEEILIHIIVALETVKQYVCLYLGILTIYTQTCHSLGSSGFDISSFPPMSYSCL